MEEGPGLDRRKLLKRLAVGSAVVWSSPMVSRTAFAATAASCVPLVLDWNTFEPGTTFTSANVGGTTVTLTTSFFGGTTALGTNRTVRAGPQGGVPGRALRFEQTPNNNGGQLITIGFSEDVFNVSFTITDIDNFFNLSGNGWSDRIVVITPTNYSYSMPAGSTVIGAGTATGTTITTGPFRNSVANNNYPNSSPGGNVTLTFPGPLTQFQFQFRCASVDDGSNQLINLTNISFCG
jgi:hypothetical protein